MARFCTLCSSSSGNSTYIGTNNGGILIDAGTNAKRITMALANISVDPCSIKAIFVTHEHTDHISAIRVFASKYRIPVYATEGTLYALSEQGVLNGKFDTYAMPYTSVEIGGMEIRNFRTSHDSTESCGYTVMTSDERKISVVTDTGIITDETLKAVTGSDLILLESNHDLHMLDNGPYSYSLKQRVRSATGHLSNDDCAAVACRFVNTGTTRLVLGHLSKENNTPELAFNTTNSALAAMGAVQGIDYDLRVAPPSLGERLVIF